MSQNLEYVADYMLAMMDLPKLYNATNPFSWMTMIGMPGRTNFFEGRVYEYKRSAGAAVGLRSDTNLTGNDVDFL